MPVPAGEKLDLAFQQDEKKIGGVPLPDHRKTLREVLNIGGKHQPVIAILPHAAEERKLLDLGQVIGRHLTLPLGLTGFNAPLDFCQADWRRSPKMHLEVLGFDPGENQSG